MAKWIDFLFEKAMEFDGEPPLTGGCSPKISRGHLPVALTGFHRTFPRIEAMHIPNIFL